MLNVLELVLRGFVAGIQIGMVLARKMPVSLTDFIRARASFHPECLIVVGHMVFRRFWRVVRVTAKTPRSTLGPQKHGARGSR